jgi:NitT/TauT family transport system permease protein
MVEYLEQQGMAPLALGTEWREGRARWLARLRRATDATDLVASRWADRIITTMLVVLNSLPKVALAPLFVIWMGTGAEPKIAIAVMLAIFSIVADVALGLRSVDPDAIALARVHRASAWRILWKVRFPNALPALFENLGDYATRTAALNAAAVAMQTAAATDLAALPAALGPLGGACGSCHETYRKPD